MHMLLLFASNGMWQAICRARLGKAAWVGLMHSLLLVTTKVNTI
jgi:hypothetical protein